MNISTIFSRPEAHICRDMEREGLLTVIPTSDFPEGAAPHADGSTEYDPKKPLAYFAVQGSDEAFAELDRRMEALRSQVLTHG